MRSFDKPGKKKTDRDVRKTRYKLQAKTGVAKRSSGTKLRIKKRREFD